MPPPGVTPAQDEFLALLLEAAARSEPTAAIIARAEFLRTAVAQGQPAPLTSEELTLAARIAWRNHSRCIGRLYWRTLRVRDRRHVVRAEQMFAELCAHVEESTNGGAIRPTMTLFAPGTHGQTGPRILNQQLAAYAGYENNGSVLGDPRNVTLTRRAMELGWTPPNPRGAFDLLPWILCGENEPPRLFVLPPGLIREIPLEHPSHPAFADLGLKWYALPVICDLRLRAAGTDFSAAPFSGWYMGTEIGARNLADEARYNLLPAVARTFGLDTSRAATLWKDRALLELNVAVLHSFRAAGVRIVDHHTASAEFMHFHADEARHGRDVSARWDWIVPPISGSATPVFHLPMRELERLPALLPL